MTSPTTALRLFNIEPSYPPNVDQFDIVDDDGATLAWRLSADDAERVVAALASRDRLLEERETTLKYVMSVLDPDDGSGTQTAPLEHVARRVAAQLATITARAEALAGELTNIADANRFDRDYFDDDKSFADWAQSRARHTLGKLAPPSRSHGGKTKCTKPLPDPCDEREPVNRCQCADCVNAATQCNCLHAVCRCGGVRDCRPAGGV